MNITDEFFLFELQLVYVPNLIFWIKFAQKGYFWSKIEKVDITNEFCIFELGYLPNFSLN